MGERKDRGQLLPADDLGGFDRRPQVDRLEAWGLYGSFPQRASSSSFPGKPEAMSLLKDYFENFNCMFPLFHQPTFMHLVERQYSNEPYQGSGWWASLNVALAIAHRLRVMSNLVPQDEEEKAWGYMKNAMAVFPELTMRNTDLLSVQALLGMALFMQGTPNSAALVPSHRHRNPPLAQHRAS